VDGEGTVCVAPTGEVLRQVPTGDPYATNICFGGPDRRTAYLTRFGRGELAAMPWPVPGLPLVHE
jgi:gluconolactonase